MKKSIFGKKLQLNKKTIAKLDNLEMRANKGGTSSYISCAQSCGSSGGSGTGPAVSRIYRCTGLTQTCPGACG